MIPLVLELVRCDRCIIDGELVVWDTIANRFEEFGKLKTFGPTRRLILTLYTPSSERERE
jgi:DNA ligase-4